MALSRSPNVGPYQGKNILTGEMVTGETLKELSSKTGVPYNHVRGILENTTPSYSNNFHFRVITEEPWPTEYSDLTNIKRRSFELRNLETDEEKKINSMSELSKFLGVAKKTIYQCLKINKPIRSWEIKEV